MTKEQIIAELKTYEKYKNHSNNGLKKQLKPTLEKLLKEEQEKKDNPSMDETQSSNKSMRDFIGDEYIDLAMELFAEELGISKAMVKKKFDVLMKNSDGKKLSNYDKLKCMGFDFGLMGV